MILAEELTVIKPRTRRRTSGGQPQPESTLLDIRFNMSGYLKETP
jgi:hypothetical protein